MAPCRNKRVTNISSASKVKSTRREERTRRRRHHPIYPARACRPRPPSRLSKMTTWLSMTGVISRHQYRDEGRRTSIMKNVWRVDDDNGEERREQATWWAWRHQAKKKTSVWRKSANGGDNNENIRGSKCSWMAWQHGKRNGDSENENNNIIVHHRKSAGGQASRRALASISKSIEKRHLVMTHGMASRKWTAWAWRKISRAGSSGSSSSLAHSACRAARGLVQRAALAKQNNVNKGVAWQAEQHNLRTTVRCCQYDIGGKRAALTA